MKFKLITIVSIMGIIISCGNINQTLPSQTEIKGANLEGTARSILMQTDNGDNTVSISPLNVSGKIASAGIMIGEENGYNIFLILHESFQPAGFHQDFITPNAEYLYDYNLKEPIAPSIMDLSVGASFRYPSDDRAQTARIEITFAYMDLEFNITGSGLASTGPYTIRLILADHDENEDGIIQDSEMQKGDLLYLKNEEFYYVDANTALSDEDSYLTKTRPSYHVIHEESANFNGWDDSPNGDDVVPSVNAIIPIEKRQIITWTDFSTHSWEFDIIFDMKNSITMDLEAIGAPGTTSSNPLLEELTNTRALVEAFDISIFGEPQGFEAAIEATSELLPETTDDPEDGDEDQGDTEGDSTN